MTVRAVAARRDAERGPSPRRRDAEHTRAAILDAAKAQFALHGYDRAALREIAAEVGVDVALISRYFGGKEGLFTEALKASFAPDRLRSLEQPNFARSIATMMADNSYADAQANHRFQFLLRAATSPTTAPLLSKAVQERFLGPIRAWLGGRDSMARARVFAAAYIGCLVERLVRGAPLRGRERKVFIDRVTQMFDTIVAPPGDAR